MVSSWQQNDIGQGLFQGWEARGCFPTMHLSPLEQSPEINPVGYSVAIDLITN